MNGKIINPTQPIKFIKQCICFVVEFKNKCIRNNTSKPHFPGEFIK